MSENTTLTPSSATDSCKVCKHVLPHGAIFCTKCETFHQLKWLAPVTKVGLPTLLAILAVATSWFAVSSNFRPQPTSNVLASSARVSQGQLEILLSNIGERSAVVGDIVLRPDTSSHAEPQSDLTILYGFMARWSQIRFQIDGDPRLAANDLTYKTFKPIDFSSSEIIGSLAFWYQHSCFVDVEIANFDGSTNTRQLTSPCISLLAPLSPDIATARDELWEKWVRDGNSDAINRRVVPIE